MNPYVPSFFGSWDELTRMTTNPFFAGTTQFPMYNYFQHQRPVPFVPNELTPEMFQYFRPGITNELNMVPPTRLTHLFITQLSIRDLTQRLPKEQGKEVTDRIDQTIADEIDFVCGTGPRPPFPGPTPYPFLVASELNLFANTLQDGSLKTSILQLTERIVNRTTTAFTLKKEARAA
jgi:hypothetical protein